MEFVTEFTWRRILGKIFKIPGVAGAVLQTVLSFINYLIHSVRQPFPPDLQNIITPKPLELES